MKRTPHPNSLRVYLLLGATLFVALPVVAQPIRPDPPVPEQFIRTSPSNDQRGSAVAGIVKQYLMNPHGDVDGLLLNDGIQIHFPPHMSSDLVAGIKPGDQVTAEGDRPEGTPMIRGYAITNSRTGRIIVEHGPSWNDRPLPPHLRRLSLNAMGANGPIQVLLYAPRGEVHGVILSDGTQIHIGPHISDSVARTLTIGEIVQVQGYGTTNQYGRALDATAIGFGGGRLVPLDRPRSLFTRPQEPTPPQPR